jgi:hypothetical protein
MPSARALRDYIGFYIADIETNGLGVSSPEDCRDCVLQSRLPFDLGQHMVRDYVEGNAFPRRLLWNAIVLVEGGEAATRLWEVNAGMSHSSAAYYLRRYMKEVLRGPEP